MTKPTIINIKYIYNQKNTVLNTVMSSPTHMYSSVVYELKYLLDSIINFNWIMFKITTEKVLWRFVDLTQCCFENMVTGEGESRCKHIATMLYNCIPLTSQIHCSIAVNWAVTSDCYTHIKIWKLHVVSRQTLYLLTKAHVTCTKTYGKSECWDGIYKANYLMWVSLHTLPVYTKCSDFHCFIYCVTCSVCICL